MEVLSHLTILTILLSSIWGEKRQVNFKNSCFQKLAGKLQCVYCSSILSFFKASVSLISRRLQMEQKCFVSLSAACGSCEKAFIHTVNDIIQCQTFFNILCEQLKETVLAEGIWFANQICPYMFECFHDVTYKAWEGHNRLSSLYHHHHHHHHSFEPLPLELKAAQSVLYCRFYSPTTGSADNNCIFTGAML